MPLVHVRDTGDERGKGLFAGEFIKRGDRICMYGGHRMNKEELDALYGEDGLCEYGLQVGDDSYLDDRDKTSPAAFCNDPVDLDTMRAFMRDGMKARAAYRAATARCKRNAMVRCRCGRAPVIATRDIEPGEEIMWSYGHEYWEAASR